MSQPLRIVAADDDPTMCHFYERTLPRLGHQVNMAHDGRQLVQLCQVLLPDLIIADVRMPGLDGIEAIAAATQERKVPAILVSAYHDPALMERAGNWPVMAYLVKPVKPAGLNATIALALVRFEQLRHLQREVADLRQALEDPKFVERAKGVAMRRVGQDEPAAYQRLRQLASIQNRKLADVARDILMGEQIYRALKELEE